MGRVIGRDQLSIDELIFGRTVGWRRLYGVFREPDGYSERAIFVIDKRGYIRYIDIHDIDHQPDNDVVLEVLRRIDPEAALRSPAPPPIKPKKTSDYRMGEW